MTRIPVDLDAMREELEDRKRAASSRSRALDELSEAISTDLSMAQVFGYIQILADSSNHVLQHLPDITLREVLERGGAPVKDNSKRRRATKAQIQKAYDALLRFFKGSKDKLSKADIFGLVIANDPSIDSQTLSSAWDRIRPHLKSEGKNLRHMVYWFPERSKK
jgi:hypothetical protein